MNNDKIEKSAELLAPLEKVWRAISTAKEFGKWFGVKLEAPFEVARTASGSISHPGYEHLKWEAVVKAIEPQTRFAFAWHPYAIDTGKDYSSETPTLVEFVLSRYGDGTNLTIRESGFERIPAERRDEAYRMNSQGWDAQLKNISAYLQEK